jgi:hypothetical protein
VSSVVVLRERTVSAWLETRKALRARGYDVALDFQGLLKSAALARLSGAKRVLGFDRAALREAAAAPFYRRARRRRRGPPRASRRTCGSPQAVVGKDLGSRFDTLRKLRESFPAGRYGVGRACATCANRAARPVRAAESGAAWPNNAGRRRPSGRLARSICAHRHGLTSVVLMGAGRGARWRSEVVEASAGGRRDGAAQRISADLVANRARGLARVSGDHGPTHIAAAVGAPVVALSDRRIRPATVLWSDEDISIAGMTRATATTSASAAGPPAGAWGR